MKVFEKLCLSFIVVSFLAMLVGAALGSKAISLTAIICATTFATVICIRILWMPIILLTLVAPAFGQTYEEALAKATSSNKPLVVIVGAKWCGPCQTLKADVEQMRRDGQVSIVVYVDIDARPDLAKQLMDGTTIPQVVIYSNRTGVWKRVRAIGSQTKSRVMEMLRRVL